MRMRCTCVPDPQPCPGPRCHQQQARGPPTWRAATAAHRARPPPVEPSPNPPPCTPQCPALHPPRPHHRPGHPSLHLLLCRLTGGLGCPHRRATAAPRLPLAGGAGSSCFGARSALPPPRPLPWPKNPSLITYVAGWQVCWLAGWLAGWRGALACCPPSQGPPAALSACSPVHACLCHSAWVQGPLHPLPQGFASIHHPPTRPPTTGTLPPVQSAAFHHFTLLASCAFRPQACQQLYPRVSALLAADPQVPGHAAHPH